MILDSELLKRAASGETDCLEQLLERYKALTSGIARGYFLIGGDTDDLIQEGMIGLYKAILGYKEGNDTTFKTFAALCVRRQIQTAIKQDGRLKNRPLNNSVGLNGQGMLIVPNPESESDEDEDVGVYVVSSELTPEQLLLNREQLKDVTCQIHKSLSDYEYRVLALYVKGLNYTQIAEKTNSNIKAIDNALSRIKTKLSYLAV
ncbi:MAG: sigma-70 family RNA polymerase sigma factor [Firmicutes bacterium]|nr:sigma-70 family RNA polymerase sigma factor [Bacillota bacterium]